MRKKETKREACEEGNESKMGGGNVGRDRREEKGGRDRRGREKGKEIEGRKEGDEICRRKQKKGGR